MSQLRSPTHSISCYFRIHKRIGYVRLRNDQDVSRNHRVKRHDSERIGPLSDENARQPARDDATEHAIVHAHVLRLAHTIVRTLYRTRAPAISPPPLYGRTPLSSTGPSASMLATRLPNPRASWVRYTRLSKQWTSIRA